MRTVLETERLELEPVSSGDGDELHRLFCDSEVRRYLADANRMPRAWVDQLIRESDRCFDGCGLGLWAARKRGREPLIGVVGFREFYQPPVLELMFALRPSHWRRGLAVEMARAVVAHAFAHTALDSVRASTDLPNRTSIRVLERLGMLPAGETPAGVAGSLWDQLHYTVSRRDWEARRRAPSPS